MLDASTGRPFSDKPIKVCLSACVILYNTTTIQHDQEIVEVALSQSGLASDRKLTFVDRNRDLVTTPHIRSHAPHPDTHTDTQTSTQIKI